MKKNINFEGYFFTKNTVLLKKNIISAREARGNFQKIKVVVPLRKKISRAKRAKIFKKTKVVPLEKKFPRAKRAKIFKNQGSTLGKKFPRAKRAEIFKKPR